MGRIVIILSLLHWTPGATISDYRSKFREIVVAAIV